jgi:hypothetical protein
VKELTLEHVKHVVLENQNAFIFVFFFYLECDVLFQLLIKSLVYIAYIKCHSYSSTQREKLLKVPWPSFLMRLNLSEIFIQAVARVIQSNSYTIG